MTTLADAMERGRGRERPFQCHVHDDSHASASVNVETGQWFCHACSASGAFEGFVPDPSATLAYLERGDGSRVYPEAWLDLFDTAGPSQYWSRRFGAAVASRFRCGTDPRTGHPTYPIRHPSGAVMGVVRRTAGMPKYIYPAGVRTSTTFFSNWSRVGACRVAILVEGAADVMAMAQESLPVNWQVLGCFGAGLHAPQTALLIDANPKVVVAAFDADSAGRAANTRAVDALHDRFPVVSMDWSRAGTEVKDPGDVPVGGRTGVLQTVLREQGMERLI